MKRKSPSLFFVIIFAVALVLSSCGGNSGGSPADSNSTPPPAADTGSAAPAEEPAPPAEVITWKVASQSADNVLAAITLKEIAAEVSARTNGGFVLEVYTNASLGSDREIAEGVQSGIIDAGQSTFAVLANFAPALGVSDLPYLIPDWDAAKTFLQSDVMDIQAKALEDAGFISLGAVCYGFRQCTNNVRPITTLADFNGIKFRVMQSDIYLDTFKALGAYPVGMAKAEVITALQQKTIDGQENPMEINFNEGMADVQKYLSKTSHVAAMQGYVANPDKYNALPEEYKTVLNDVFSEYLLKMTQQASEDEDEFAQKLVEAGMEYNEISAENLAAMRQICIDEVWPKYEEQYADQLAIIREMF